MSEIELKPCPFCGGDAELRGRKTSMVNCTGCSASTFQLLEDKGSAARQWNTRAPQWQPIETAPKDGTKILVWNDYPSVAFWGPFSTWDDGDWHDDIDGVTHWMPILDPPEVPDGRG